LQRALAEIHQEKQAAIPGDHNDEEPFEHGCHGPLPFGR
jgi:hypothetical protein